MQGLNPTSVEFPGVSPLKTTDAHVPELLEISLSSSAPHVGDHEKSVDNCYISRQWLGCTIVCHS